MVWRASGLLVVEASDRRRGYRKAAKFGAEANLKSQHMNFVGKSLGSSWILDNDTEILVGGLEGHAGVSFAVTNFVVPCVGIERGA